jgi:predicted Holliday junction resolvase-like endonuclease
MTFETILLIIFGIIILALLFIVYIMYVRIQQLLREFDQMESRMKVTDSEIEALARNVEEIKKLKI